MATYTGKYGKRAKTGQHTRANMVNGQKQGNIHGQIWVPESDDAVKPTREEDILCV